MSTIKSYSVGNGDMFYINHNSDGFTIIAVPPIIAGWRSLCSGGAGAGDVSQELDRQKVEGLAQKQGYADSATPVKIQQTA